ncbi:helix-turn-helix transcriptional regulator [Streptomyces nojiriensis]|uniref:helix-turn-helix transcriptional regulator n=1 Tax=Streptomyces nojiriensis TaxID=66374 RepID=UPI0036CEBC97
MSPRVSPLRRGFLNVREAAEYLGLSPATLYVWRHRRQGPPSFRMGPERTRDVPDRNA